MTWRDLNVFNTALGRKNYAPQAYMLLVTLHYSQKKTCSLPLHIKRCRTPPISNSYWKLNNFKKTLILFSFIYLYFKLTLIVILPLWQFVTNICRWICLYPFNDILYVCKKYKLEVLLNSRRGNANKIPPPVNSFNCQRA